MIALITGFDPFGGEQENPSFEAVKKMPDVIGKHTIVKVEIPTQFDKSLKVLDKYIDVYKPDVVVCVGQAGGRSAISIERVAINLDDARIPDNSGFQPVDLPIDPNGPVAYFSSIPIKAMTQAVRMAGFPVEVSNTAGTFVCNHIMYGLLHMIHNRYQWIKGGFIHVPFCEKQVVDKKNVPSMNLGSISKALEIAIVTALETKEDIQTVEGCEC